jgi:AraC family transcriptional regulator
MTVELAQPRFEEPGSLILAGLAKLYTPDKLSFIPTQWTALRNQLGFFHGRVDEKSYGVWSDVLSGTGVFMYFTGVAVGEFAPIHPLLSRVYIQPQRYAVFTHRGSASDIRRTTDAVIGSWLPKSGYQHSRPNEQAPDFIEVYGENFDPTTGLGDIEVWLPVKK